MTTMNVTLRSIPDTGAAIGWAGAHTVVVDRPHGKAGGAGLRFNGGQLLAPQSVAAFATTYTMSRTR
jgi:hypothetical protein